MISLFREDRMRRVDEDDDHISNELLSSGCIEEYDAAFSSIYKDTFMWIVEGTCAYVHAFDASKTSANECTTLYRFRP